MVKVEIWNNRQCLYNGMVNDIFPSSALLSAARNVGLRCDETPQKINQKFYEQLKGLGDCVGKTYNENQARPTQHWTL